MQKLTIIIEFDTVLARDIGQKLIEEDIKSMVCHLQSLYHDIFVVPSDEE